MSHPSVADFRVNVDAVAGFDIAKVDVILILLSVELLNQQSLIGVCELAGQPVNRGDVVFTWITGQIQPHRFLSGSVPDADLGGGVRLADFGVSELDRLCITLGRVVNHRLDRNTVAVQLPERQLLTVGAETQAISQAKFLFVDPIESSADQLGIIRAGDHLELTGFAVFQVQVVVAHEGDRLPIRSKGRKHGFGVGSILAANLAPGCVCRIIAEITQPIVAAGVLTPDSTGVVVDQQTLLIGRKRPLADFDWLARVFVRIGVLRVIALCCIALFLIASCYGVWRIQVAFLRWQQELFARHDGCRFHLRDRNLVQRRAIFASLSFPQNVFGVIPLQRSRLRPEVGCLEEPTQRQFRRILFGRRRRSHG